ncbi:MAG: hypothetical protein K5873_00425 [Treponema sp.]|nr:hypothetical protein [Treponema sp.]
MKILKKFGILALLGAAFMFAACSDSDDSETSQPNTENASGNSGTSGTSGKTDSSSSDSTDKKDSGSSSDTETSGGNSSTDTETPSEASETPVTYENAAAGDLITINGVEYAVLENTYSSPNSSILASVRSAARAVTINDGFSEDEKTLILRYMDMADTNEMLAKSNITEYIKVWAKNGIRTNMPYQQGGTIYCSDYFGFIDKNGVKLADFQLNWTSGKVLKHMKNTKYDPKDLSAVQEFEEMVGLPVSSELASGKYTYEEINISKYIAFRTENDPSELKVKNFPENQNKEDISGKYYDAYSFNYDTSDRTKCKVSSYKIEDVAKYDRARDYHYITVDGTENLYFSHKYAPEQPKDENSTQSYYNLAHKNYNIYTVASYANSSSLSNNPLRNDVYITASGTGKISDSVTAAIYNNKMTLSSFGLGDTTSSKFYPNLIDFYIELTGSSVSPKKYRVRMRKDEYKSELSFANQKVRVYEFEYSSSKFSSSGTEIKKEDNSYYTLAEAVTTFLDGNVYFSSETKTVNDYVIPAQIKVRAPFPDGADFNKDFTIVTFEPEAQETTVNGEAYKAFVYKVEENSTIGDWKVPEFVKKYSDGIVNFYTSGYTGADNSFPVSSES